MLSRRDLLAASASAAATSAAWAPLGGAFAQTAAQPAAAARTGEAAKFHGFMDTWMKRALDRSPELVTGLGLDKGERAAAKSKLSQADLAQVARDEAEAERSFGELKSVDRNKLTGVDQVHYDSLYFGRNLQVAANKRFKMKGGGLIYVYPLHQLAGSYQSTPDFLDNTHTIETAADAEAYISRLDEWARYLDQEAEVVRHDVSLGIVPPDFAMDKALVQMKALRDKSGRQLAPGPVGGPPHQGEEHPRRLAGPRRRRSGPARSSPRSSASTR